MTHQSDTGSFLDRAHHDGFSSRSFDENEVAAWPADQQADILAALRSDDSPGSAADAEPRALGQVTYLRRGTRLGQGEIYVLRDAIVSVSIEMSCHVALAHDGDMAGLHRFLLPAHPQLVATVVRQGHAVLMQRERLRRAMRTNEALYLRLLGYAFRTNAAYLSEAASTTALTVEQRVARWLVRYATASHECGVEITHQELSTLLAVRRAGVTNALHILEGEDLLRSRRGRVEFLHLDRLAAFACIGSGDSCRSERVVHN